MQNIYETLNKANNQNSKTRYNRLPKEEYAKQKKAEREQLYKLAENQCRKITSDSKAYLSYLNLASRIDYTVTNILLVMAQKPEASVLKDNKHWKDDKYYVKKGEKGIKIIMPVGEYQRNDGSIATNYAVKNVFDVSQLDKSVKIVKNSYSIKEILDGILYYAPVEFHKLDRLDKDVIYSPNSKAIFYKEGLTPTQLISGLLVQTCYAEFNQQYTDKNLANESIICDSAGYILCRKYGIEVSNTAFADKIQDYFSNMEINEIKEKLSTVKSLTDSVSERMEKGIYKSQIQKQNQRKGDVR